MMGKPQHGFTLVELLVTMPIFIISIAVLIGFMVTLYTTLLMKDSKTQIALQAQLALSAIQDDLYFARNFAETPSGVMVDVEAPGGDAQNWTFNTSPPRLVVYEIALDKVRQDASRQIVYQNTAESGNSCTQPDIELNPPVLNNIIYYVDGSNLKRRVLVPDPTNVRCAEPYRQQTCNTNTTRVKQTPSGPVTVLCPADSILATGVKSFSVDYYDANNNLIDMSDGGSPLQAERITVKLTLERTIVAEKVEYSTQLTITKVNGGDPDIQ